MTSLELKVPPLVVLAGAAGAAWVLSRAAPIWQLNSDYANPAALALFALGAAIGLAGVVSFRSQRTTVNPLSPERAARVVRTGVFRWSRNPMYLGMLLVLAAIALYLGSAAAIVALPAFIWYMNRFQIEPEERALGKKFGAEYAEYTARVRRWL